MKVLYAHLYGNEKRMLGYEPKYSLYEGLKDMFEERGEKE